MQYVQILFADIAVLHSLLEEVDPGFVVCLDFDRAGDVEHSASVANFLSPNGEVAEMLNSSFIDVVLPHAKSNESLPYEGADVVAVRLQRKFDAFESQLCSDARQ